MQERHYLNVPYKEKDADGKTIPFPDDESWRAYQKAGGKLSRAIPTERVVGTDSTFRIEE